MDGEPDSQIIALTARLPVCAPAGLSLRPRIIAATVSGTCLRLKSDPETNKIPVLFYFARSATPEIARKAVAGGVLVKSDEVFHFGPPGAAVAGMLKKSMPNKKHASKCMQQQRAARIRQFTSDCSSISDGAHGRTKTTIAGLRWQTNATDRRHTRNGSVSRGRQAGRLRQCGLGKSTPGRHMSEEGAQALGEKPAKHRGICLVLDGNRQQ